MKKLLTYFILASACVALTACELNQKADNSKDYKFINKSDQTVHVTPQANSGWSGFALQPGESKVLKDIDDLFFTFEPVFRVEIGDNEGGRIVFINLKSGTEAGGL